MGSFRQSKRPHRWLWQAIDHTSGEVLADDVLASHEDSALYALME
ncbi:MAG: hypothetical protein ACFB0E_17285 [Leptolyngbyaceae cyanobacterium]